MSPASLRGLRFPRHDIDLQPDELGRDLRRALAASLRPAIFDRDGATFAHGRCIHGFARTLAVSFTLDHFYARSAITSTRQHPRQLCDGQDLRGTVAPIQRGE